MNSKTKKNLTSISHPTTTKKIRKSMEKNLISLNERKKWINSTSYSAKKKNSHSFNNISIKCVSVWTKIQLQTNTSNSRLYSSTRGFINLDDYFFSFQVLFWRKAREYWTFWIVFFIVVLCVLIISRFLFIVYFFRGNESVFWRVVAKFVVFRLWLGFLAEILKFR